MNPQDLLTARLRFEALMGETSPQRSPGRSPARSHAPRRPGGQLRTASARAVTRVGTVLVRLGQRLEGTRPCADVVPLPN